MVPWTPEARIFPPPIKEESRRVSLHANRIILMASSRWDQKDDRTSPADMGSWNTSSYSPEEMSRSQRSKWSSIPFCKGRVVAGVAVSQRLGWR